MAIAVVVLPGTPEQTAVTVSSFLVVASEDDHIIVDSAGGVADERLVVVRTPDLASALANTADEWVTMVRAGDQFEPGALAAIEAYLAEVEADVVYSDHRTLGAENGTVLKPRWLPHLLEQAPYLGRLVVVRRELAHRAGIPWSGEWDYQLRVTEHARHVGHIPVVAIALSPEGIEPLDRAGAESVRRHLERIGDRSIVSARPDGSQRVRAPVPPDHLVSIIVPTRGARRALRGTTVTLAENLLRSLARYTAHPAWELVLVASEGSDPEVLAHLASLDERVSTVWVTGPFNFSTSINAGACVARGQSLLLLNDDVEVLEATWLTEMLGVLLRPGVGAVGARLLFEDRTIQHVGVVCPPTSLPLHPRIFELDAATWDLRLDVDYLAVTGACLLTDRSAFFDVGGLTEDLPLNFNDVDYCLKLRMRGLATVCVNAAALLHFESSSRTAEILDRERDAYRAWEAVTLTDPHTAFWDDPPRRRTQTVGESPG